MRKRIRILPYKAGSGSARALSQATGIKRLRLVRTRFRPRYGDTIINWGNSHVDFSEFPCTVLNANAARARDKLVTLRMLTDKQVPTVGWTEDREQAQSWSSDLRATVYARLSTTGQGGSGIVVVPPRGEVPRAPLYTRGFLATHEWRIHTWGDKYYAQKKRRRNGVESSPVRNHDNGYVYCTNGVIAPVTAVLNAHRARMALGLDFCAVDMLQTRAGETRVLEVNTAPGLVGSTLDWYAERVREIV